MFKLRFYLFFIFFLASFYSNGQDLLQTNGKAIINSTTGDTVILRGMGLGGWMVQEGYMLQTASFANPQHQIKGVIKDLIGEANTDIFYEKWLENHVRKIDIDSLASWGFNSVRLPMHYNLYTLPIEEEPMIGQNTWLDKGFELTDSLVSWCKQNNMWVILDLHATPGGQGYDEGISDYDPNKPSLWESTANQAKTVALWKKLAERYADEPAIAGYDLINETNWDLPGGVQLRNLYETITDSIRSVDNDHIIFIEGNWFANDFTGLTPPWDDNMVYSPHKYWSTNNQSSIQWVLDLREQYNVPLYLGESGENSNVWFRDAIRLLEDNGIGWAWWPMKKVEAIAGPLSVQKTGGYQNLLNYWEGNGSAPSAAEATASLMELTEKLKIENCFYQKDVIDAMFRQVYSDEPKPYNTQDIPGTVFATDYDMGRNGVGYYDVQDATYHVSTGNYTSWNNGWAYRNDGVDLERNFDQSLSNGFSVGWTETGEWLQYDINVLESAVYDIEVRMANGSTDGAFHFSVDGADLTTLRYTPNTGGYQSWETITLQNVILTPEDQKLKLHVDEGGFNVGSFTFVEKQATTEIPADFFSAMTTDDQSVQLNLNKRLVADFINLSAGFEIFINGSSVNLMSVTPSSINPRIVDFVIDGTFLPSDVIKISYTGTEVNAIDGTTLQTFIQKAVQNNVAIIHDVPGKMEAEDFFFQSGIVLESTTDEGGGENLGFLDAGDYMDYTIDVAEAGEYLVEYRTASESGNGQIQMQLLEPDGSTSILQNILIPPSGGWQTWRTASKKVDLEAGRQNIRLSIIQAPFNLNWINFSSTTSTNELEEKNDILIYPNPTDAAFFVNGKLENTQDVEIRVYDVIGKNIYTKFLSSVHHFNQKIDLNNQPSGIYFIWIKMENGGVKIEKLSLGN